MQLVELARADASIGGLALQAFIAGAGAEEDELLRSAGGVLLAEGLQAMAMVRVFLTGKPR